MRDEMRPSEVFQQANAEVGKLEDAVNERIDELEARLTQLEQVLSNAILIPPPTVIGGANAHAAQDAHWSSPANWPKLIAKALRGETVEPAAIKDLIRAAARHERERAAMVARRFRLEHAGPATRSQDQTAREIEAAIRELGDVF
jgi:hypothetical protein